MDLIEAGHALHGVADGQARFREDLREGLRRTPKELPCKYLYDARGSELFERICELEEYYPTRTELAILERSAPEMAALLGPGCLLVEYGSGSARKTGLLLEQLEEPAGWVPIDISRDALLASAARLSQRFPRLPIRPVHADFAAEPAVRLGDLPARRTAVFFPGSTIGNFRPREAIAFLRRAAALCGPGGGLLIGVDLRKAPEVLERAYDDRLGVTAAFDLNVLARANRELGTDFQLSQFRHRAPFDAERGRIEMRLVSLRRQTIRLGEERFLFENGEWIRTECSYKYAPAEFGALAAQAGWRLEQLWVDPQVLFSVQYLTAARGGT
jgi:dimethylhistidine N-methyltransferase